MTSLFLVLIFFNSGNCQQKVNVFRNSMWEFLWLFFYKVAKVYKYGIVMYLPTLCLSYRFPITCTNIVLSLEHSAFIMSWYLGKNYDKHDFFLFFFLKMVSRTGNLTFLPHFWSETVFPVVEGGWTSREKCLNMPVSSDICCITACITHVA